MNATEPLLRHQRYELLPRELHVLLSQAFERIRPIQCKTCTVPAPVRVARAASDTANWTLPASAPCEHNCASFIRWLSVQYGRRYDIADSE